MYFPSGSAKLMLKNGAGLSGEGADFLGASVGVAGVVARVGEDWLGGSGGAAMLSTSI